MLAELTDFFWSGPQICRTISPISQNGELYLALLCGIQIAPGFERQLFLDTGLIHLLVVSGAHLYFIERWIAPLPFWLRWFLLGTYVWLCGWSAPVVRAWWRRLIAEHLRPFSVSALQVELVTSLSLLCAVPSWLLSRSFLMCWICGLALSLAGSSELRKIAFCYLFLFPFCLANPLSMLANLLVAPFIGAVLLPITVLATVFSPLVSLGDFFWRWLLDLLNHFPATLPAPVFLVGKGMFFIPLIANVVLLVGEVFWRRKRLFS